jgi:monoamine oxidase
MRQFCHVVVIGAGAIGALYAARWLAAAGVGVLVLEAQSRVGGCTVSGHFSDGTFVDDGGQWVSPGQGCIVGLAEEFGVRLFPSSSQGATVHWRHSAHTVARLARNAFTSFRLQRGRVLMNAEGVSKLGKAENPEAIIHQPVLTCRPARHSSNTSST